MGPGDVFADYDKVMEDPEYRARMERVTPLTAEEESEMYTAMDALADAQFRESEEPGGSTGGAAEPVTPS